MYDSDADLPCNPPSIPVQTYAIHKCQEVRSLPYTHRHGVLLPNMTINAHFQGLCQTHKGRRWGIWIGGFRYKEGCWERAHAQAHDGA